MSRDHMLPAQHLLFLSTGASHPQSHHVSQPPCSPVQPVVSGGHTWGFGTPGGVRSAAPSCVSPLCPSQHADARGQGSRHQKDGWSGSWEAGPGHNSGTLRATPGLPTSRCLLSLGKTPSQCVTRIGKCHQTHEMTHVYGSSGSSRHFLSPFCLHSCQTRNLCNIRHLACCAPCALVAGVHVAGGVVPPECGVTSVVTAQDTLRCWGSSDRGKISRENVNIIMS